MAIPRSQAPGDCPIGYYMQDRKTGKTLAGPYSLIIRPEEMTRNEPSRLTVLQTLGGAWVDDFGLGISQINISGHTGWRGTEAMDAIALFMELRQQIYLGWHAMHAEYRDQGKDPRDVELVFSDVLNQTAVAVAPLLFRLRRSKSRPLLMFYDIQLLVLGDLSEAFEVKDFLTMNQPQTQQVTDAALVAISASAQSQASLADTINSLVGPEARAIGGIASASSALLGQVVGMVQQGVSTVDAVAAPLITAAASLQAAAFNLTQCLIEPLAITYEVRWSLMQLSSSFGEAKCNLLNNFPQLSTFFDFSGLFGSSNCSSTSGGLPMSSYGDVNPFLSLYSTPPSTLPQAPFTADAAQAVSDCGGDILQLNSLSTDAKLQYAQRIAAGINAGAA